MVDDVPESQDREVPRPPRRNGSPPKVLVELGAYVGSSAVAWGQILRDLDQGQAACRVFTVELEPAFASISRDLISLAGLSDVVTVLQGQSGDILRTLKAEHGVDKIDVLFIDHWEKFYLPDLQLVEELGLFRKGSLVLADNTDNPGTPAYLAYVKKGGSGEGGVRYESVSHKTVAREGVPVSAYRRSSNTPWI